MVFLLCASVQCYLFDALAGKFELLDGASLVRLYRSIIFLTPLHEQLGCQMVHLLCVSVQSFSFDALAGKCIARWCFSFAVLYRSICLTPLHERLSF